MRTQELVACLHSKREKFTNTLFNPVAITVCPHQKKICGAQSFNSVEVFVKLERPSSASRKTEDERCDDWYSYESLANKLFS